MKSIIFIAPPAAGKGTQSMYICEKYNLTHISTGDLLREEVKSGNEFGKQIQEIMESGSLVSDDIILKLLTNKLDEIKNGYVLDGFPRNVSQAKEYDKILENINQKLNYVIYLNLPKELAKKRITGRISCPNCGNVYNEEIEESKPLINNICDKCHTSLVKRKDDNEETFEKRYETYINETEPLVEYYKNQGNLFIIDSTLPKEEISKQIENIIND
ncbi:MAG: adenylate kinase [Bacilli bacterium]|nr:adenylate kinase [Bacilli bacterium]